MHEAASRSAEMNSQPLYDLAKKLLALLIEHLQISSLTFARLVCSALAWCGSPLCEPPVRRAMGSSSDSDATSSSGSESDGPSAPLAPRVAGGTSGGPSRPGSVALSRTFVPPVRTRRAKDSEDDSDDSDDDDDDDDGAGDDTPGGGASRCVPRALTHESERALLCTPPSCPRLPGASASPWPRAHPCAPLRSAALRLNGVSRSSLSNSLPPSPTAPTAPRSGSRWTTPPSRRAASGSQRCTRRSWARMVRRTVERTCTRFLTCQRPPRSAGV